MTRFGNARSIQCGCGPSDLIRSQYERSRSRTRDSLPERIVVVITEVRNTESILVGGDCPFREVSEIWSGGQQGYKGDDKLCTDLCFELDRMP